MSLLDVELRMTKMQRDQLTELFADGFDPNMNHSGSIYWPLIERLKQLDAQKVADVLTESQMQLWHANIRS